ncbi:MAG: type III-B CRISPR module RAMP protein Cmr1 [Verrucomicrobia bacterium]|nr:type III-B CRISPR module RAMP protein Cmr1 [Verrucomicrobiota bacterium]
MKVDVFTLEFITPCFAAGAEQAKAELRASEVRGQLRWWFRALGGSRDREAAVFGTVAGESAGASAVQIRTLVVQGGPPWPPPNVSPMSDNAYIWYFASVSGKKSGQRGAGPRWTAQGNMPPGTKFEIQLRHLRDLPKDSGQLFQEALDTFLLLGGLGLRVTRGLGAFVCLERPATDAALGACRQLLLDRGFRWVLPHPNLGNNWQAAIDAAGNLLRHRLRPRFPAGKNGDQMSPLGSSKPRQTSAVYLRPVRRPNGTFALLVFEAPAQRVLGRPSRGGAPASGILAQ